MYDRDRGINNATSMLSTIVLVLELGYSGTPLNRPPLGPVKVSLLEGWPHFRGEFVLKSMLWDFSKWPEYRGGHISGVLIRGIPIQNILGITDLNKDVSGVLQIELGPCKSVLSIGVLY